MPKAEEHARKVNSGELNEQSNCEILRTIFQLRALSSNIPASQKGVYLLYNPPIDFRNARALLQWKRSTKTAIDGHGVVAAT